MAAPQQHVTTALTKRTRDGRTVRVEVVHTVRPTDLGRQDDVVLIASLDGVELGRGWALTHPRDLPAGATAALGRAAFTAAEAAQIEAALKAVRSTVPPNLEQARAHLVEALRAAQDIATEAAGRAHDAGELDPYLSPRGDSGRHEQAVTDALQALEAFDREHPELVAALERRRRQDVLRWAQQ
ncbi:hypothetical protein ACOQFV_24055 [Nocardiopsis changdeensis]|uniref:Uncharacterized protein n=1 Tax=Nocardiopsis changdeensis TaxID=2831969 RepID=A0A975QAQ3_9ACTN|nr:MULTISPECIES: hypothetical protein [Nocardiopsis]QUX26531.1 hypothetical protein KGD84_33065 [Nocardiopsis changdeensis]QYX40650.1 hypothetical protein K1J57_32135 [Nocardiopsis sp. MT53]